MVLLDLQGMETPQTASNKLALGSSHCDGGGSDVSLALCG
jgi:Lanthionine-containing peptide SapB precursor RamS